MAIMADVPWKAAVSRESDCTVTLGFPVPGVPQGWAEGQGGPLTRSLTGAGGPA